MDAYSVMVVMASFVAGFWCGRWVADAAARRAIASRTDDIRSMYEVQSKFITDVAHALQTPIAILRGNVEILERSTSPRARRDVLRVVRATVDSMARLVGSMLEGARLKFDKDRLYRVDVAVGRLLEEVCEDCAVLCADRGVACSYAAPAELVVHADRDRLKEVLLNLVSNALKHTPPQGAISLEARSSPGGWAEISVADTGCGIAPDAMPHLFERFYRIQGDGTGGIGVGLHIAREVVEAHGGTIRAESELGKGSCFTLRIPSGDLV